jgi:ADP-ribose pyrophosphatase YjhB (NUDIX family)
MKTNSIIVRVYGIYINPSLGLLVSDEIIFGKKVTKFPGGGLEFGEGTTDCLKREMMEETGNEFEIISHFYTTDFFVPSAFHAEKQVLSIYYTIKPVSDLVLRITESPFENLGDTNNIQSFRYIKIKEINSESFTLAIDRHVASMLSQNYKQF